jgi:hypothetical protein
MTLTNQFLAGVPTDATESVVHFGDDSALIRDREERVLIDRGHQCTELRLEAIAFPTERLVLLCLSKQQWDDHQGKQPEVEREQHRAFHRKVEVDEEDRTLDEPNNNEKLEQEPAPRSKDRRMHISGIGVVGDLVDTDQPSSMRRMPFFDLSGLWGSV